MFCTLRLFLWPPHSKGTFSRPANTLFPQSFPMNQQCVTLCPSSRGILWEVCTAAIGAAGLVHFILHAFPLFFITYPAFICCQVLLSSLNAGEWVVCDRLCIVSIFYGTRLCSSSASVPTSLVCYGENSPGGLEIMCLILITLFRGIFAIRYK